MPASGNVDPELAGLPSSRELIREFIYPTIEELSAPNIPLRGGRPFPFVTVVIPAYNEQDSILGPILSLRSQTRLADRIIVLADNCTDDTVFIAMATGASVVETSDNGDGKAGALNRLLDKIMPLLHDEDTILVMDADTMLTERFIESTIETLFGPTKKDIAGVGGIFLADDAPWSMVRQLQSNEYVRYRRRLARRHGRALVLTGTGTVFKVGFLREAREARREGRLPDRGRTGGVYDISALTEDNELTICAKELGHRVVSPKDCTVTTAMMPTWRSLFRQRLRWQRGALENLIAHRLNVHTAPYAARQVLTYLGVAFLPFYLYTLTVALHTHSSINFLQPLWISVAILYVAEQTFSVRQGGWRAMLVSVSVIPELLFTVFLHVVYLICFFGALFATDEDWGRMRHLDRADFDKYGRPRNPAARPLRSPLHGTHPERQTWQFRVLQIGVVLLGAELVVFGLLLPIVDLQAAWNVIAVYVLTGSVATIGRLIPVRTC